MHLILFQRSLRLSSILFILFPLFCSSAVICTILSSNSFIHSSASVILLLTPSRVFFNFSNCVIHLSLLILYFFYVLGDSINCVKIFLAFSPLYFKVFEASLLSLFWILFRVVCLFHLNLFGLVSFYLVLSFALCFSIFS